MRLKHTFSLFYSSGIENRKNMTKEAFQNQLQKLTSFNTDEEFWQLFLRLKLPTSLQLKSKLFIFKRDISPIWEQDENKFGGRIYVKMPLNRDANDVWQNLVLEFLTGFNNQEFYDEQVNGIELSIRQPDNICLAIWVKNNDIRMVKEIFYYLKRSVPFPKNVELDYSDHPKKFMYGGVVPGQGQIGGQFGGHQESDLYHVRDR